MRALLPDNSPCPLDHRSAHDLVQQCALQRPDKLDDLVETAHNLTRLEARRTIDPASARPVDPDGLQARAACAGDVERVPAMRVLAPSPTRWSHRGQKSGSQDHLRRYSPHGTKEKCKGRRHTHSRARHAHAAPARSRPRRG